MTPSTWMPLSWANMFVPTTDFHAGMVRPAATIDVLGDLAEALGLDADVEVLDVLQRHDDLLERRVARALARGRRA